MLYHLDATKREKCLFIQVNHRRIYEEVRKFSTSFYLNKEYISDRIETEKRDKNEKDTIRDY